MGRGLNHQHKRGKKQLFKDSNMETTEEEIPRNKRLQIMERVEKTLDVELDFMEEVLDAKDEAFEEQRLLAGELIPEDEDYLYNLERHRLRAERDRIKGTLKEPSLIVCWVIVFIVTMYVIILSFAGERDHLMKDEL